MMRQHGLQDAWHLLRQWRSLGVWLLGGVLFVTSSGDGPSAAEQSPTIRGNTQIDSFEAAKRLAPQVYAGHEQEFYCGCRYQGKTVDLASCGYQPSRDPQRAQRLEWEHVVPAEAFGESFREWREGHPTCVDSKGRSFKGRNCAKKMAPAFRYMEGDLHNLQPAIGEVNGVRSNYSMAMLSGELRAFGARDVEIHDRKIEPRPEIRGILPGSISTWRRPITGEGLSPTKTGRSLRQGTVKTRSTTGSASGIDASTGCRVLQTRL